MSLKLYNPFSAGATQSSKKVLNKFQLHMNDYNQNILWDSGIIKNSFHFYAP